MTDVKRWLESQVKQSKLQVKSSQVNFKSSQAKSASSQVKAVGEHRPEPYPQTRAPPTLTLSMTLTLSLSITLAIYLDAHAKQAGLRVRQSPRVRLIDDARANQAGANRQQPGALREAAAKQPPPQPEY